MNDNKELLKLLLESFRQEASEGINKISDLLIQIEKDPYSADTGNLIEVVYREAHSLKGAARAVNLTGIESLCHGFEDVMSLVKNKEIILDRQAIDVLYQSMDLISAWLSDPHAENDHELSPQIHILMQELASISKSDKPGTDPDPESVRESERTPAEDPDRRTPSGKLAEPASHKPVSEVQGDIQKESGTVEIKQGKRITSDTIRLSAGKLEQLLTATEELINIKTCTHQQFDQVISMLDRVDSALKEYNTIQRDVLVLKNLEISGNTEWSIQAKKIQNVVNYLDWNHSLMTVLRDKLNAFHRQLSKCEHENNMLIDSLHEQVIKVVMVPMSWLTDSYPQWIRSTGKELNKDIDITIVGADIEMDRRILENIKTPLMHILRNSVDYGIEKPEERKARQKTERGMIKVNIERLPDSKIQISVSDDGGGINYDKLRQLYMRDYQLDQRMAHEIGTEQLNDYIFKSGVSSSEIVTDLSGRGLGLAIVKDSIEELGGNIRVESNPGHGTSFHMELPVHLQSFKGVVVNAGGKDFIIQNSKIDHTGRFESSKIKTVRNKKTIVINGEVVPLAHMGQLLNLTDVVTEMEKPVYLLLVHDRQRIALIVDEVLNEEEVLVKNLTPPLVRLKYVQGAAVTSSGRLTPVLHTSDLIDAALESDLRLSNRGQKTEQQKEQQSILVVEDSITSRTLIKNILQTAGYRVSTAIDGLDGFTQLKEGRFDAVVSDVEMPRMSGFELTARIRSDEKVSDIPVILVTGLARQEHREKGIEVGANAYIVKSSFDQSNLLSILEQLI